MNKVFIKSGLIALSLKVSGAIIAFLLSIILSRILGGEQIGTYYLALSIATVPLTVAILGFNIITLKNISYSYSTGDCSSVAGYYTTSTIIVFLTSFIATFSLYAFSEKIALFVFEDSNLTEPLKYIAFSLLPVALFNLNGHSLQARKEVFSAMLVMGLLHNLTIIIFVLISRPVSASDMSSYYFLSAIFVLMISFFLWFREKNYRICSIVSIRKYNGCISVFISQILTQLYTQAPLLLIGYFHNPIDVAHYAISLKIAMLISFILQAINRVVAPDFSRLYKERKIDELNNILRQSIRLMLVIALPMSLVITIFSKEILYMYGEDFTSAADCLVILALSQLVYVLAGNVNVLLQMTDNSNVVRDSAIISSAVSALLCILLIPDFGIVGASFGTLFSLLTSSSYSVYKANKKLKVNTIRFW
ncbi:lipid II flippase MurJ [Vibrio coralliirubri]|uniref:lipid II flippase MurJ n=1 Tax=Vibrio coralliirubri TaxID=1516159 RepID=UPI000EFBC021|nr:lipid II flippase MurJ [Vibrio coralliirubri]